MAIWVSPARFGRLVAKQRPATASRTRDLFDAYVRSRVRLKTALSWTEVDAAARLVRACQRVRVGRLATWEDLVALRELVVEKLPRTSAVAARAILLAGEQLEREGHLPGRPRHRGPARCRGCERPRSIECVKRLLCPQCVGRRTLVARFDRLCERVRPVDAARCATLDLLIEHERANGIRHHSLLRVHYLAMALVRIPDVRPVRTWRDLRALREQVDRVLTRAGAHKARWAVFKLGRALLARGVLPPRLPKTIGSIRDQLRAPLDYFDRDDDPRKLILLRLLIDFYSSSRVTLAALQVVWALAYHLARNAMPDVSSWTTILAEGHRVREARGPWSRRILTALLRVGDALERRGELAPLERTTDLAAILRRVEGDDEAADLSRRAINGLHHHGRRPSTLLDLIRTVNRFWTWARERGATHPAQVSSEMVRDYLRQVPPRRRRRWCGVMRTYFRWLRRERLVLHVPVPGSWQQRRPSVRVATRRVVEQLVHAMVAQRLPPEDALLLYLVVFHCARNFEAAAARFLGYERGVARIAVPTSSDDVRATPRPSHVLILPTHQHAWLRSTLDRVLERRATILKHPSTPYLFVRDSWRGLDRPLTHGTIRRRIVLAVRRLLGMHITPTILRDTGATLVADASDPSVCLFLGWSPTRAIDFGYARREVIDVSGEDENDDCKKQVKRAAPQPRGIAQTAAYRAF